MLLVLQKINKLKVLTAWDATGSCEFSLLQNCFQAMDFSTARWEGQEGLK